MSNKTNSDTHMDTYTFIQLNQSQIQNVDGCLTADANVTILHPDGRLAFYYFEGGKMGYQIMILLI
jgi:hypothetical protein